MSECLISSTNLKLKIRTSLKTASMMINSNTRFSSKSLISFRLDFVKIEVEDKRYSNWFECRLSSWRNKMMSTKFWYLSDRRLARVDLMLANCLMIASDLVISRIAADRLFWWSDDWMSSISEIDWTFSSIDSTSLIDSMRNDLTTVLRKSVDSNDKTILQVSSSMSSNLNDSVQLSRWLRLSRHISTSELRDRSWIEIIIESLRMFKASII
jgi:hypothetical protein